MGRDMHFNEAVPKVAIIPVTYKCNAKCVMCNIWEQKSENDISLDKLLKFFEDPLIVDNLQSVNLTGGEPTLRSDLVGIAEGILSRCSQLKSITVNTNGFIPERLETLVVELCRLQNDIRKYKLLFFLSVDGLEEIHDKVRGVPGSFKRVIKSIDILEALNKEYPFSFSINFTINQLNFHQMEDVYDIITGRNIKIDFTYSMKSPIYFGNMDLEFEYLDDKAAKDYICNKLMKFMRSGNLSYSQSYYKNLIKMIRGGVRRIGCIFSNEGFFINPSGDVYRCWAYNVKLGNIYENSFSNIWNSSCAVESISNIRKQCETCYNNCYSHFKRIDSVKNLLNISKEQ